MTATATPSKGPTTTATTRHTPGIASTSAAPAWAMLSFVKAKRVREYYVCSDWFAVPDETYPQGRITGLKVMAELVNFGCAVGVKSWEYRNALTCVLEAACKAATVRHKTEVPSRNSAADEVLRCMAAFFMSVHHADAARWLQSSLMGAEKDAAAIARHIEAEKAEWVQRMKAAKAAKRAARTVEVAA